MRALDIIFEKTSPRGLETLKSKVKAGIDQTDDEVLLNRIYTTLNSGDLTQRLHGELHNLSDPEIRSFQDEIANAIISAPGTFEEKMNFVNGLKTGYVDIQKMIDGNRHHFSDLLKPTKKVPLKFLFEMFNELKDLGGKAKKGPGEFALAIMSPQVSVFGSGDLKIGNQIVEVKAGSGTIGDTSMFQHQKVHIILQKFLPNLDTSQAVGAEKLVKAVVAAQKQGAIDKNQLSALADELADYIFKGQPWANTNPLKQAIKSINVNHDSIAPVRQGYLTAAYSAYKQKKDKSTKFDGIMLINFDNQELRYFDDPGEMYNDVDTVTFSLSHPNAGWGGKLISPSVNLRREPIAGVEPPKKQTPAAMKAFYGQTAEYMIKMAQQRWPRNLDLREPALQADVAKYIEQLASQNTNHKKIPALVKQKFPDLNLRAPKPEEVPQQQVTPARKLPSNPPAFSKPRGFTQPTV